MAKGLGTLTVWLSANTKQLTSGLAAGRKMLAQWKTSAAIGAAAGAAAITGAGISAVKSFMEQENALASLQQTLKSTNFAAGFNLDQLKDFSSELQKTSTFGDEAIQKGMSVLATFTNVKGDVFKQATQSALDLSTALGTDVQSSVIQLGKALNDPIQGITALSRVGVSFTDKQKDSIKALVEAGKMQEAQQIILNELQTEFGGQAAAAASTTEGRFKQMMNVLGDVKELFGEVIVSAFDLNSLFGDGKGALQSFHDAFKENIGAIKVWVGETVIGIVEAGQKIWAVISAGFGNVKSIFSWVLENSGKLFSGAFGIAVGFFKDLAIANWNFWAGIFDVAKTSITAIWDYIKSGGKTNLADAIGESFVTNMAKFVGELGTETEKALKNAGVTQLKLTGIDDLAAQLDEITARADQRRKQLFETQLKETGKAAAAAVNATDYALNQPKSTSKPRSESSIISAVQKGTIEALRIESTRTTKEDKIADNTLRTAVAVEKLSQKFNVFTGAPVIEPVEAT